MADLNDQLIHLALQDRLLTRKQADLIREDLKHEPGASAGELMLRRHYITEEQLGDLMTTIGGEEEPLRSSSIGPTTSHERTVRESSISARPDYGAAPLPPSGPSTYDAEMQTRGVTSGQPVSQGTNALQAPREEVASATPKTLIGLLRLARHWGCSDLHLTVGRPPFVRMNGEIRYMETEPLTAERAMELNFSALTDEQRHRAFEFHRLDFGLEIAKVGRHRCSIFEQRLGWDGAYRIVPQEAPTIEKLGLPPHFASFMDNDSGLIAVAGTAGSGKSTTIAALLNAVNQRQRGHIVTIEDPVEYVLQPQHCQITQREIGRHTRSFASALRAATRQNPDVIMVSELRDFETISLAISAAETGYLVLGSISTNSVIRAIDRLVDAYPQDQQRQALSTVSETLRVAIAQQLIPKRDGSGAVMALEVLINVAGVNQLIREGKSQMLTTSIQGGRKIGMMLMDESLMALVQNQSISGKEAYFRASNKQSFEKFREERA